MEFPHHRHTHHHKNEEEKTPTYPPPGVTTTPFPQNNPYPPPQPPPPQPPFYGVTQPPPPHLHEPVPQVFHTSHVPPPQPGPHGYPSAPAYDPAYGANAASARHVSHENEPVTVHHVSHETRLPHRDNFSSSSVTVHHVGHHSGLSNKPTVKVVTKADPSYSLTIRDGKVILARSDPRDEYQHWYKDEKYSTRVKDEEGCPGFSLVNKVTGEAIKHSIGATHPVKLVPYKPDILDESILWTESKDLGDGHRAIRMVNNIHLNVDAYHGDKHSGGVHDGTTIVLWKWNRGDNQRWKIIPYCKFSITQFLTMLYYACAFLRCLLNAL